MATAAAGALGQIRQIALTISDLERSIAFYRDALRLPFLFQAPPGLAFFDCAGIRLMLSTPEGSFTPGGSGCLYFKVDAIDTVYADLQSRKVAFVDTPHLITRLPTHELWMWFFKDPDGNTLALLEERKA